MREVGEIKKGDVESLVEPKPKTMQENEGQIIGKEVRKSWSEGCFGQSQRRAGLRLVVGWRVFPKSLSLGWCFWVASWRQVLEQRR